MTRSLCTSALMGGVMSLLLALCLGTISPTVKASIDAELSLTDDPEPSPTLEPSEVVRIQVEALRQNDYSNQGIALTYRFASPGNKLSTGPLARFTEMVRSPPYDQLLNHVSAQYSPMAVSAREARQVVLIVDAQGEEAAYVWILSRQGEGEFEGCWMTDAVIPAEPRVERRLI